MSKVSTLAKQLLLGYRALEPLHLTGHTVYKRRSNHERASSADVGRVSHVRNRRQLQYTRMFCNQKSEYPLLPADRVTES